MLKILTRNNLFLQNKLSKRFGSAGPVNVVIDKDAKWIKYNTSRKLACVDGIQDIHYKAPQYYPDDPYAHLRNAPYFSFNYLVYNDPWHHDPQHELYADDIHGYILGDDPNDMRYDLFIPAMATTFTIIGLISIFCYTSFDSHSSASILHEASHLQKRIDNVLGQKAKKIKQLQDEIRGIKEK